MNREQALELVNSKVHNKNLVKHMLASEAIMRAVARKLGEDEGKFGLTGLLHDLDFELTEGSVQEHGKKSADMLKELGVDEDICHAIMAHNENLGVACENTLDKALVCSETLTGLVVATALVNPEKLQGVTLESLKKKMPKKDFARNINRELIKTCTQIGIELDEFLELSLKAMQDISGDLGL